MDLTARDASQLAELATLRTEKATLQATVTALQQQQDYTKTLALILKAVERNGASTATGNRQLDRLLNQAENRPPLPPIPISVFAGPPVNFAPQQQVAYQSQQPLQQQQPFFLPQQQSYAPRCLGYQ